MTIFDAAIAGNISALQEIIKQAPDAVRATLDGVSNGDQALHLACWQKQLFAVQVLMESGADIDSQGLGGRTPLHYAVHDAEECNADIVYAICSMLLSKGADPCIADEVGFTPRSWAKVELGDYSPDLLSLLNDK